MNNNHPEVFRFYNNVFTKNPDKKIINNLFLWNKKITKEKYEILSNIILQLNELNSPLPDFRQGRVQLLKINPSTIEFLRFSVAPT
jgi:hypothetical protein